jgi:pilus assembly protein Flp/PilA
MARCNLNGRIVVSLVGFLRRLGSDQSGATAIEYGLIAALIALAIVGGATTVGGKVSATFTSIGSSL